MKKFCTKCKKDHTENDNFCPDCGTELVQKTKWMTSKEEDEELMTFTTLQMLNIL